MTSPNVPQLDYAPAPPMRRKWIRLAALLVLASATTFGGFRWGPAAVRQARILYWQRKCMQYGPGPDTVVYEEMPDAAARLFSKSTEYSAIVLQRKDPQGHQLAAVTAAAAYPTCIARLLAASGPTPAGTTLIPMLSARCYEAVVFLHALRSPCGHRRLVLIAYLPDTRSFNPAFVQNHDYQDYVLFPATLTGALQTAKYRATGVWSSGYWPTQPPQVRIFAGQADPADASHFTIRYQMWGQEDIVDGKLNDDDSVVLAQRHMPIMPGWHFNRE